MAGDKEGCFKLVLLQKNTSENTALVLQCIFCIRGYWSELSCRPWSTNYEHLTFVSRSSPLDPLLAPAASIDTRQQQLCWLLESSECSYYKLGLGRWVFASLPLVVWGIAASRCPFCSSAKNAWVAEWAEGNASAAPSTACGTLAQQPFFPLLPTLPHHYGHCPGTPPPHCGKRFIPTGQTEEAAGRWAFMCLQSTVSDLHIPLAAVSLPPFPPRFFSMKLYFSPRCIPFSPTAYSKLSSLLPGSLP